MSRKRQRIVPREVSKKDSLVQHSPEHDIERPDGEESLQETLHFDEHRGDTRDPEQAALTGGVDAAANRVDAGEEVVGGDNPTPDQDIVDEIGAALGVTYQDDEELKAADKIIERDRHRWELDPASAEDYKDHDKD